MSGGVRVRFSGLVLFASNVASFLLGFVFVVLVSRNLSQGDLGAWFFIGSFLAYFEVLEKVFPYWALRDAARGRRVARTAVAANALLSAPLTLGFLLLSWSMAGLVGVRASAFLVAALLLPIYYATAPMNSVIYARFPHMAGARTLIVDGVKIPLALLLLPYGLEGVLGAVAAANLLYMLYALRLVWGEFEEGLRFRWLRERVRHAWLPLLRSAAGYLISASDSFLVGVILSPLQLSYYGVGRTISNALKASERLSFPLSVKILSRGAAEKGEVGAVFKLLAVVIYPMTVGGLLLAPNLYGIFGPAYVEGAWVLWPLLLSAALSSYSAAFRGIVKGLEKADAELEVGYGRLLRSRLLAAEAVDYLFAGALIAGSLAAIPTLGMMGAALSRLAAASASFLALLYMSFPHIPFKKHLSDIGKVLSACAPMAAFLYFFKPSGALMTLLTIACGALMFFGALYLIDGESRGLFKAAVAELSKMLSPPLE